MTSNQRPPLKRPRKNQAKLPISVVYWYDAVAETGWVNREEAKKDCRLSLCVSVGHVVDRNDERILIACTKSENEYNAMINIPNAWVREVKEYTL